MKMVTTVGSWLLICLVQICLVSAANSALLDSPTARQAEWEAAQERFLLWNASQDGWITTSTGLQYRRDGVPYPDAPSARIGCQVSVDYEGRLINGQMFGSSAGEHEPLTFSLDRLISGWREGVPLMHVGETYTFAIPAPLAYGSKWRLSDDPSFVSIPPGSALLFKVTLVALPSCNSVPDKTRDK